MLKDTLNKGISTPIAIGIVLILVIIVGTFTWLQYGEMWKESTELPEIELPEKEEVEKETEEQREGAEEQKEEEKTEEGLEELEEELKEAQKLLEKLREELEKKQGE